MQLREAAVDGGVHGSRIEVACNPADVVGGCCECMLRGGGVVRPAKTVYIAAAGTMTYVYNYI